MRVYATLRVADLGGNPPMWDVSVRDWAKIPKILSGAWPQPIPPCDMATDVGVVARWIGGAVERASFVAVDTEYDPKTQYLTLIGLGYPEMDRGLQVTWPHSPWLVKEALKRGFETLVRRIPVVYQNAVADLPVIEKALGITYADHQRVEDTMLAHACLWSDLPHDLGFLDSVYGNYTKLKHLADTDMPLYNWGDVLATITAWMGLRREFQWDPRSYHIYDTLLRPLIPVILASHEAGLRVDQSRVKAALDQLETACANAQLTAQAHAGWNLNLGSPKDTQFHIFGVEGHKRRGKLNVQAETMYDLLAKGSTSGVVRARLDWTQAESFRKYVAGLNGVERVYPEFLPTQATGRWSTKKPPLTNFPAPAKAKARGLPNLRECFVPDEGTYWLCWDWKAMHARFMAAACKDPVDLRAFATGEDIHLLTMCQCFRLPLPPDPLNANSPHNGEWRSSVGWQPEDRRRHLAKTVRYALLNGIDATAVREAKEVVEQGLDLDELERVGRAYLQAKPMMPMWKRTFTAEAIAKREARSLYGRKRRLYGDTRTQQKAAISHFLQGTEVDVMEETLIRAVEILPARLVYPSHDGIKLALPESIPPKDAYDALRPVVERSHDFWGTQITLPAEWEVVYADGRHETL